MMEEKIIDIALEQGATLAGIAAMKDLRRSPSHVVYRKIGRHEGVDFRIDDHSNPDPQPFVRLETAGSLLVIGLSHPEDRPELDWWDGRGTPGNRQLIDILDRSRQLLANNYNLRTRRLHYYVEKAGVFLKDAAVLAGLGSIGRNNLLITPEYGPRVRLRALFLDRDLCPTGPLAFDPCVDCPEVCRTVCPEKALAGTASLFGSADSSGDLPARDGAYVRQSCNRRMLKDDAAGGQNERGRWVPVKYCRLCEFACPVGRQRNEPD